MAKDEINRASDITAFEIVKALMIIERILKPIKATVVKSAFISRGAKSNRLIFI
jgi:hypothetical protein